MERGNWKQIQKYMMLFSLIGGIVLLGSCGIKENTAKEEKAVSDAAIVVSGSAIEELETPKATKESIPKNQTDNGLQNSQEENTKVEFSIHNNDSHAIMGVTLPKGWDYSFVGSSHEDICKDNKCCCSDSGGSVRTVCTCSGTTGVDKESAWICQNAYKGKGEQSTDKNVEEYGICFWKEENPKVKIQYLYHKERLLFCGTGVTIGKETLENAGIPLKAESLMEEIEKHIWHTLILDRTGFINGKDGDYAIEYDIEKKLWKRYQKEIEQIMEGITLSKCR